MPATEALDEEDVVNMDVEDLKGTSRDIDVDPDELAQAFPSLEHHMTVKGKLRTLAKKGAIDATDIDDIHNAWQEK